MPFFRKLNIVALILCFGVIVFGAYVRLSDAGLGCPDWPGCYGHLVVPEAQHAIDAAKVNFPNSPVHAPKAWKEMIHRYLASTLGLLILGLAALSVLFRKQKNVPRKLPWLLVLLVCFQGALGMWTVTWQLKPLAVTGHLLMGMTTLAALYWMWLSTAPKNYQLEKSAIFYSEREASPALKIWALLGLVAVVCQIFLGGWTSSNYAALACPDLPTCQGAWWPASNFKEAFVLWRGLGQSYQYGVLNADARISIHLTHRLGACVLSTLLVLLSIALYRHGGRWKKYSAAVLAALTLQVCIGLSVVHWQLPLWLADAHNAGAGALLLTLITVLSAVTTRQRK